MLGYSVLPSVHNPRHRLPRTYLLILSLRSLLNRKILDYLLATEMNKNDEVSTIPSFFLYIVRYEFSGSHCHIKMFGYLLVLYKYF